MTAAELERRLSGLDPIGRGDSGWTRLAWTPEDEAAGEWFAAQAAETGLQVLRDPAGNRWAVPDAPPPWWAVGSHTDTVRAGGRYDGALGVAAGFAVAAQSDRPVAVLCFADEEGARFNTPTFGSRALTGALAVEDALARTDDAGVTLADALRGAGVDPEGLHRAPEWLDRLRGLLELHIDQTPALDRPAAAVARLVARMRVRARLRGRADHAGTTLDPERRDALSAAARLMVAAEEAAASRPGAVATAARIHVEPNAATTVPALAVVWLDARAPDPDALAAWRAQVEAAAAALAAERGVEVELVTEAHSSGTVFDPAVRAALREAGAEQEVLCYAGHDAGIVGARRPSGMVLVRNATGISHSPAEAIDLEDAAVGTGILLRALGGLA